MNSAMREIGIFRTSELERQAPELAVRFSSAEPFPHVVVDDLLQISSDQVASFPDAEWPHWDRLGDTYQLNKYACSSIEWIPEPFHQLITELSEPRFLRTLEQVTGIRKLLPDPYLVGGGLHLSGPGGILSPHTDFHLHRVLDLYRRINLLVYLNAEWSESDGGCLQLYDDQRPVKTILPLWGRVVLFQTDDRSVHGFPTAIVDGRWRRSVALYYYTAQEAASFSGDATTYWRDHGARHGIVRDGRMIVYRMLLHLSRGISILAHLVNPNQGLGLFKTMLENRRRSRRGRH